MTSSGSLVPIPWENAWVSLPQIDCSDLTYVITFRPEIEDLVTSIGRIGLTNQPLLQRKKNGFRLVTGYRRILALKRLGKEGFHAKIVEEAVDGLKLFLCNLYENLSTRSLNEVERSYVVEKLISQFNLPRSRVRDEILPLLGLGKNDKVLDTYLALARMEEGIKEEIAEGRLSWEAVKILAPMDKPEREEIFLWIKRLRLGKNKQRELLVLLGDLTRLKGLSPSRILEHSRMKEVMAREDWPLPVKAQKIEEYLKKERYPVYKKAEEEYRRVVKELKLPPNLSLNPPPYFEGEEYELRLRFRDKADLEKTLGFLLHICEGRALERLLSIP